jgi:hypothetical protein
MLLLLLLLLRKAKESSQLRMCLPDPHMRLTCSDQWVGAGFGKSQKCNRLLKMFEKFAAVSVQAKQQLLSANQNHN